MHTAWARKKINKQTNKREKLKKETITKKKQNKTKQTNQKKQTKRNKDVTEGRLLLIFF